MIKTLLRTVLILFIVIIASLAFLLTPMGLRFSIDVAVKFLPAQISYKKISGIIIGPITIDGLHYHDKNKTIDVGKFYVSWHPLDLLKSELHIGQIDIQQLRYETDKKTVSHDQWGEKTTQLALDEFITSFKNKILPFHLKIDHANVSHIQISNFTTQTTIEKIVFNADFTAKKWNLLFDTVIDKPEPSVVKFSLQGNPEHYSLLFSIKGDHTGLELAGTGDQHALVIHTVHHSLFNGSMDAHLQINWGAILSWNGLLTAKNINLSLLNPQWVNPLSINIQSTGNSANHFTTSTIAHVQTPNGHAKISLIGNFEKQSLLAHVNFHHTKIQLALDGHTKDLKKWTGTLSQLSIALDHYNSWQLRKPAMLTATENAMTVAPLCLHSNAIGNACFQGNFTKSQLNGSADIDITHLNWLRALVPDIRIPSGHIQSDLKIQGTLANPDVTGSLNLSQSNIVIPKLHITLNNIGASITSNGHLIDLNAQAYSQQQPIHLDGQIDLSKGLAAQLSLTSDNALIMHTDQYTLFVTADLKALIQNRNISVTGNITIPKGTIQPNDVKITTALPEHDIVYVDNVTYTPKPFWAVNTNVAVNIGDDVHTIDLFHINALLGGSGHLIQQPNQSMFATGQIFVRKGTFTTYGQTLTVEPNSYVSYDDSLLNNPTLDLRASKIVSTVDNNGMSSFSSDHLIVGVELHGTVKAPVITFFSNRNLSQADILSYIFLGYGTSSNTPGNTDFLLRAITAMNISSQGLLGKQDIASQIQSGLGLSEMGVESETASESNGNPLNRQSAFVVGKHLTRNLYVRYSIGLLDPVNVFEMRYLFTKHWAVQTDSSTLGNGADVLYTFERN